MGRRLQIGRPARPAKEQLAADTPYSGLPPISIAREPPGGGHTCWASGIVRFAELLRARTGVRGLRAIVLAMLARRNAAW
jgi:hypothetical protein